MLILLGILSGLLYHETKIPALHRHHAMYGLMGAAGALPLKLSRGVSFRAAAMVFGLWSFLWQVVLTILRFLALVLMVGSIALSLHTGGEPFGPEVSVLNES